MSGLRNASRAGSHFLAHYTWSKFLDDVAAANEYGDPQSYMDAYNRRLDKSLSRNRRAAPHRAKRPIRSADHGNRLLNAALGSWKVGLII